MAMSKEKMLALLDETVEFYGNNPRAIQNSVCVYKTREGHKCAIGRLLTSEEMEIWLKTANEAEDGGTNFNGMLEKGCDVPEALKDFPLWFATQLQTFHDTCSFWCEGNYDERGYVEELSESGKQYVAEIRKNIG
jgi:hypothetical protein